MCISVKVKLTLIVSSSAVVGSFLGGYLTEFVPQHVLRKAFAIFVLTIGPWVMVRLDLAI